MVSCLLGLPFLTVMTILRSTRPSVLINSLLELTLADPLQWNRHNAPVLWWEQPKGEHPTLSDARGKDLGDYWAKDAALDDDVVIT
jgi:hypothetical protein